MAGVTASANVSVGKPNLRVSGGILRAPLGSERPTDPDGALDSAYESAGYVGEDGVSEASERSTEDIRAWGGIKVRTVQTEYGTTLTFTFIESRRALVLKSVFGESNVTIDPKGFIKVRRNETPLESAQWVVDMKDGDRGARRLDVGNGQITEVGDISYVDGEAISYEVTMSCDPDDNGDTLIEYVTDPDFQGGEDGGEGDDSGEA
jgi:hypothetical protein